MLGNSQSPDRGQGAHEIVKPQGVSMKKWVGLGLLAILVALGVWTQQFGSMADLAAHYTALKAQVVRDFWVSLSIFFLVYVAVVALSLPFALLLTLAGSALFGWWGLLPIWLGATAGAAVVFVAVRYFFADWAAVRLTGRAQRVRAGFLAHPFRWALTLRLVPVMPFWMANALPAVLGMAWGPYLLSTAIGILPGTAVYVGIGVGFDQVLSQGGMPDLEQLSSPEIWGPLLALGLLTAASTWVTRTQSRESK